MVVLTRRRRLLAAAALAVLAQATAAQAVVTDLAGRSVRLPTKVERILLGEGRMLSALAVLERANPVARVVGLPADFEQFDPAGYAQWLARFPRLGQLPRTGCTTAESFSVEQAIALRPDLALFGLEGHGPSPRDRETLARLHAAGVTVLFIDLRQDPLVHTVPSIELIGRALGREREAAEFAADYRSAQAQVTRVLARRRPPAPAVFLENRVGLGEECCPTMVEGLLGRMVDAAGGRNVARGMVPGAFGTVSLEYLLAHPPEVWIGTAIGSRAWGDRRPHRVILGPGVDAATARASLERVLRRPGIARLPAVRAGRAHAVWHHFYSSPFNVVALQAFAKWLHPELFAHLDPRRTLETFHRRYQPVPLEGTYWVSTDR